MYESYYGFSIRPFKSFPDPGLFYLSPKHQSALTYLEYGIIERSGFILLTGEIGTGKTTLIKYLLSTIKSEMEIAFIFNTNVSPDQLLSLILNDFEIGSVDTNKLQALDIFYNYLIEKYTHNKQVLLIIDEAQNLSREALEEVRMLSNLQSDDQTLLQIMLVGQPELRTRLRCPDLAQLNQRITMAYHITALSREETGAYIAFRLEKAGGKLTLFTTEAVDLIHQASRGIPRSINILCDMALVCGFVDEVSIIDVPIMEQVIQERIRMGLSEEAPAQNTPVDISLEEGATMYNPENIETRLNKLKMDLGWRMDELEKTAVGYKDDLIGQLNQLYLNERQKNEKLLSENSLLDEMYALLQKEKASKGKIRTESKKKKIEKIPRKESLKTEEVKGRMPNSHNSYRKEECAALQKLISDSGDDLRAGTGNKVTQEKKRSRIHSWIKT